MAVAVVEPIKVAEPVVEVVPKKDEDDAVKSMDEDSGDDEEEEKKQAEVLEKKQAEVVEKKQEVVEVQAVEQKTNTAETAMEVCMPDRTIGLILVIGLLLLC